MANYLIIGGVILNILISGGVFMKLLVFARDWGSVQQKVKDNQRRLNAHGSRLDEHGREIASLWRARP